MDDNELEPEVLTYQEFINRQTLLAWQRRLRAYERQQNPWEGRRERSTNRSTNRHSAEERAPAAKA
jgi:hypothetical protein